MPPARRLALALCAALALPATGAIADPIEAAAEALIPTYASASTPPDLTRLYRLQLAAGCYGAGEKTLEKLQAVYRPSEPGRANGLVPWRIYARAERYTHAGGVKAGQSFESAFAQAFAELYGALPDQRMAEVLPWWGADLDQLSAASDKTAKACAGTALAACPTGAEAVAADEALAAWRVLMSAGAPLIRADAERRFQIDDQLLIPTPDGAQVAAMLVRPRTPGKRVALLNFTIYAKDSWSFADAVKMAAYGYAGVVAYTRGKGRSPGPVTPYVHDGVDAATVIEWLARQPWSDGRVGMFSGSYNASTQWAAVKHHPAALKAIATNASNAPGVDTPMQGNVFQSFIYAWPFYTTDTKALDDKLYDDPDRWAGLERKWYASGRPYRDLDKIDGTPNPVFDTWLDHPSYDAYWRRLIPYGREFAKVDIPVFVETGYYDGGMAGALYYLQQHYRYRPQAEHRLLVGPYHHTAMQTGVLPVVDGYTIDPAARIDLQEVRLKWFDHVFHGAPLPELLRDKINFEVMGANRWRHVGSLAAMSSRRMKLYLSGERRGPDLQFGPEIPRADAPSPELRVDFADRSDADYRPPEDQPDARNALVFSTQPFAQGVEVYGLFRGRFTVVTNKRDFDLAVDFYERRADGRTLPLASYLARASYMGDRSHRRLLPPGRPVTLAFESQTLTARRLMPGSRIIAVVGVPKRPELQINYGTGKDVSDESIADAKTPLTIRWRAGSYLDLGISP
jgi:putative CocE/NonD family hydrolase